MSIRELIRNTRSTRSFDESVRVPDEVLFECADAARLVCGPEFTDKFKMWRLSGGGAVPLDGAKAVVVVTGGEGRLNGLAATRGDRFVAWGESALKADGRLSAIVSA